MTQPESATPMEASAPSVPEAEARLPWRGSLLGKVTAFILIGVFFAYGAGAAAGLIMFERGSREQWWRQAEMNAQIASSTIRRIYTFVVVDTDPSGQVSRIVTERPLGDEESVLDTGFNPTDILALAAAQTKNDVWLFRFSEKEGFVAVADALGSANGITLAYEGQKNVPAGARKDPFVGFARIGKEVHFVSALPILSPSGELLGSIVSSIGQKRELYQTRDELVRNSLFALLAVLVGTAAIVAILMRRMFRPVPKLIESLTRIAQNDTGTVTPFLDRTDEIGRLAEAIETLREAVVEREHLRLVKEAAQQLEHLAHHDPLTGLPNRAFLNRALENAMGSLPSGQQINFFLFDLDRFKAVNDTFGHAAGDALLIAVTHRVTLLLGAEDIAARLGGDEFAIIQQVSREASKEAERLASRLVEAIGRPFAVDGRSMSIGASVGIASAPADGRTSHDLLTNSDIALYAAKNAGRGNFVFYKDGMVMKRAGEADGPRRTGTI